MNEAKDRFPQVRIGTSGWHYPHWRGLFYPRRLPAKQWLGFYARHFDTVEINASSYRLPAVGTFGAWRDSVEENFIFSVKASRQITHWKKLSGAGEALASFLSAARHLGGKLGPVLFQLPPHWRCDAGRLSRFLALLPQDTRAAFELRDPSWHNDEIYALLRERNAAFCIYDLSGFRSPRVTTADFAYIRLHGPDRPYAGCYSQAALGGWARYVGALPLEQAFVYFDNDEAAYAARNALELKEMLAA